MIKNLKYSIAKVVISILLVPLVIGSNITLPKAGEKAPNFSLDDLSRKKFSLFDYKGKKALLLWFTNLCRGCQAKFPEIERIKKLYRKKQVEVVAVSVLGDDKKIVEKTVQERKLKIRFLIDPKGEVVKLYSGTYYPGTCPLKNIFIIDKRGIIRYSGHYPGTDEDEIIKELDQIQNGM